jgi:hypothetical protein
MILKIIEVQELAKHGDFIAFKAGENITSLP